MQTRSRSRVRDNAEPVIATTPTITVTTTSEKSLVRFISTPITTIAVATASIQDAWARKHELELIDYDSVHHVHREDFICSGYRARVDTAADALATAFTVHNETGNIWTHFVAFVVYLGLLTEFLFSRSSSTDPGWVRFLLASYILCMAVVWLTSALAHTFCCLSPEMHLLVFKFDYIMIFMAGLTCNGIVGFYVWRDAPTVRMINLLCAAVFSFSFTYAVAKMNFADPQLRLHRALMLLMSSINSLCPFFYKLWVGYMWQTGASWHEMIVVLLFFVGGSSYYFRFPERWWPGRFDHWGHSHQWLHVFAFTSHVAIYRFCADNYHHMLSINSW